MEEKENSNVKIMKFVSIICCEGFMCNDNFGTYEENPKQPQL